MKYTYLKSTLLILTIFLAFGCNKKTTDDDTEAVTDAASDTLESAMSQAGSSASASEGGTAGFLQIAPEELNSLSDFVDPQDAFLSKSIHPLAACSYSTIRGACANSSDTVTWGGCTIGGGTVTMTGTVTEVFSGTGASNCTIPVSDNGSVVRTTTGTVATLATGATITNDTNGGTAWDGTVLPSTGESVSKSGTQRTVILNGLHSVKKGPRGRTQFDVFITSSGFTVDGTRADGTRSINGPMKIYHNVAKYTATNTFTSVTWGDSTCCYPTSGNISSVLTGSLEGTTTLTFSTTCGTATAAYAGTSSTVTLRHCR